MNGRQVYTGASSPMVRGGSMNGRQVYTGGNSVWVTGGQAYINGVVQSPFQNHGDPITYNANLSESFNGIDASGLFAIDYEYSNIRKSFEVTLPEKLKENVVLSVENSILVVRLNFQGQLFLAERIKLRITGGALSSVELSGESSLVLYNPGRIANEEFQVKLSDQSEVNAKWINSRKFVQLSLSDQSRMESYHVDAANQFTIVCSGQSEVTLKHLYATDLDVATSDQSRVALPMADFTSGGLTASGQSRIRITGTSAVKGVHADLLDISTIGVNGVNPELVTSSIL